MLRQELQDHPSKDDLNIFGSCHAYSSFHVPYYQDHFGHSAFNISNPGEFIPITYINMAQQFKIHAPKVALVDIWGIQVYNTYSSKKAILGNYALDNLESIPLCPEKLEVLCDFREINALSAFYPIVRYHSRIYNGDLHLYDFNYSLDAVYKEEVSIQSSKTSWVVREAKQRIENKGTVLWPSVPQPDYPALQAHISDEECAVEPVIMKYVDKIINLCAKYDVQLIFYRAPYISNSQELMKVNYLHHYLDEKNIPFYDLEEELSFDYETDFLDLHHLSETGMVKATEFLGAIIEKYM